MTGTGSAQTSLVVIRGNSGSGKSTIACRLRSALPHGSLAIVSQDVVRREILRVHDKVDNLAVNLIDRIARYALDEGMHVIIEGILFSEIYATMLNGLERDHRGTTIFHRLEVPFEETLRRHAQRPASGDFGEPEMRQWWRDDDPLPNVREWPIGSQMSVDEIVALIASKIIPAGVDVR